MTNRAACEASDLFKAVGPVSGNIRFGNGFNECRPTTPLSWLSICGNADSVCNLDFELAALIWADAMQCDLTSDPVSTLTTGGCVRVCMCVLCSHTHQYFQRQIAVNCSIAPLEIWVLLLKMSPGSHHHLPRLSGVQGSRWRGDRRNGIGGVVLGQWPGSRVERPTAPRRHLRAAKPRQRGRD